MKDSRYINDLFYIEAFKCYLRLLDDKSFSYKKYLDLFEVEKNEASSRRYKRIIRYIKDVINDLKLKYLLVYSYKDNSYKLVDLGITGDTKPLIISTKYAYIRIYNLLKAGNKLNREMIANIFEVELVTVSSIIKNIATALFEVDIDEMIKFNYHINSYEIIYGEYDDDYLDYIYGRDW